MTQLQFLLRYDDCLDVRGLHRARGSGAADTCAWLLDLCVARDRGCLQECVSHLLCAGVGWLLTHVQADPDGHICAGEHRAV